MEPTLKTKPRNYFTGVYPVKCNYHFIGATFLLTLFFSLGIFGAAGRAEAVYPVAGQRKLSLAGFLFPFCVFFAGLAIASPAYGAEYYVRTDGNNSCSGLVNQVGTSGSCAWRTLQYAADTVVTGDTVNVADGNYAGFMIQTAGALGAPINFQAIGSGANITSRNPTTADGINIEAWGDDPADYITIDGFNVYNQPRMGIRAIAGTGIVIKNCISHNNTSNGIFSGDTPGIQVLDNTVYANGSSAFEHNIYISNAQSDNPVIRGNVVRDSNAGNGLQLNGDWEMGGDGYIDNAMIENNIVYNSHFKGFSLISVRNAIISNNITYGNHGAGGVHIVEQLDSHYSSGNTVVNNTLDETATACVRINAGNTANVVFNNVCLGSTGIAFEGSGNFQSNNLTATAGFTNRASHDYSLTPGAAQIGAGLASYQSRIAPAVDFLGTVRPQGGSYDVGAYEFVGGGTPDLTPPVLPGGLNVH